jgi:putative tryptophan/tyrosine transport system substrate-binding protein
VFHLLADPFAVGAGKSDTDHLPNITGVYSPGFGDPEQARRIELIKRVVPAAKQIGIVFSPEEQLSVVFKDKTSAAATKAGLTVATASVSTLADVGNATRSLCSKKVDAIEIFGNVAHSGFAELIKIARECKVPVFSSSPFEVMQGATASIFPDFAEGGAVAGKMIARILKGEKPSAIPFFRIQTTRVAVNPGAASKAGATIPADLVKQADTVVGPR